MSNARRLPLLALLAALCACAQPRTGADPPAIGVSAGELPALPVCRGEMRAFVEVTKLAKLHGDGWTLFEPAVDAMKAQILDCLEDHYPEYRGL